MVRIFCNSGSRGSSTGSSKNYCCYPRKHKSGKGFRALGSRGSSSSNFSAKKIKLGSESEKCIQGLFPVGINPASTATSATRKAKALDTQDFFQVAVLEIAATRTATPCYPQHQFRKEENRQWYITRHCRN
nr:MAG TPA: hypothetical protein [Caudoviricetes sp.]